MIKLEDIYLEKDSFLFLLHLAKEGHRTVAYTDWDHVNQIIVEAEVPEEMMRVVFDLFVLILGLIDNNMSDYSLTLHSENDGFYYLMAAFDEETEEQTDVFTGYVKIKKPRSKDLGF